MKRRSSNQVHVGRVAVGGGAPVSVQSMTNTRTSDADATLAQINELAALGCDIIRCAVPDMPSAETMRRIVAESPIPVIADIHFDWRLALESIRAGVHGVRINPGNIGGADRVRAVAEAAGEAGIPIRVGANTGSLPKGLFEAKLAACGDHDEAMAESLCEAVEEQICTLESCGFHDIKVSLKASSVPVMVAAYRKFAARSPYPLHLGVTEAGTASRGILKSAAGIGALLLDGIGDTIRVSLTAPPREEVKAGITLLEVCGLRDAYPEIVSCPTCARTEYDLIGMAERVEELVASLKASGRRIGLKKIAVMGCVVNGPGEAKDAEFGLAGSKNGFVALFRKGVPFANLPQEEAFRVLEQEILSSASDAASSAADGEGT